MQNTKDKVFKQKILSTVRRKNRESTDFSMSTIKARRWWNKYFLNLERKSTCQLQILHIVKFSLEREGKIEQGSP